MKKMNFSETSKFKGGNLALACGIARVIFFMYAENYTIDDATWYAAGAFFADYCQA